MHDETTDTRMLAVLDPRQRRHPVVDLGGQLQVAPVYGLMCVFFGDTANALRSCSSEVSITPTPPLVHAPNKWSDAIFPDVYKRQEI